MTTTLATTPHSNWQTIAPLLQALGCGISEDASPETWYLAEQNLPEGNLLLAYTHPRQALINAMEDGQEPADVLKQWEEHTQALVTLYKNNRRRAVMVDVQQVASNLERTAETLASHWQQSIELPKEPENIAQQSADPYYQLIATIAIHQNNHLSHLLTQLEACSLPVAEHEQAVESPQDINALYWGLEDFRTQVDQLGELSEQYQALNSKHLALEKQSQVVRQALKTEVANAEEKQKAGAIEQDKLQKALNATQTQQIKVSEEADKLRQELEQAREDLRQNTAALEEENQLLVAQLHLVQEELEGQLIAYKEEQTVSDGLRTEIEELKTVLAATEQEHKAGVAEIDRLRQALNAAEAQQKVHGEEADGLKHRLKKATSERNDIVADLEAARQQEKQTKATLEEENQLVIEQLHLVQEELESQLLSKQALEKQLIASTQEQDHALEAANQQISQLQNKLNKLKNSASWKASAPLRAMGRPFKRMPPDKRKLKRQAAQLAESPFFDAKWYLKTYPDVAEKEINPAEHYLKFGADEGRDPSEDFDTDWYLRANPDIQESGINPLIHFLNHGREEGRAPNPQAQNSLPSLQEAK